MQLRNKIPDSSSRTQTVQDQKECLVHYKFFPPKRSNILSSIVRTFMAACPFERAKYLPSKWILRHDVAHFETELSIKLFLPMVKPPLYFLDFCQCGFGTPPQKKKLQRTPFWCYWTHSELYNKIAVMMYRKWCMCFVPSQSQYSACVKSKIPSQ